MRKIELEIGPELRAVLYFWTVVGVLIYIAERVF